MSLFAATPTIQGALEIGRKGELYTYEQNFTAALECFTSALNVLVPILPQEPAGKRKEVLQKQVRNLLAMLIRQYSRSFSLLFMNK